MTQTQPAPRPPVRIGLRDRVALAFSRRQHVEMMATIVTVMVIQSLAELRMYTSLGFVTLIAVGCRDLFILVMFAEEERFLSE